MRACAGRLFPLSPSTLARIPVVAVSIFAYPREHLLFWEVAEPL